MYKINGDWTTVKQSIAFVAVKRYLSNILTDAEKQKTLSLFLGEFRPNSEDLSVNLWDAGEEPTPKPEDLQVSWPIMPPLFPQLTLAQKLLQVPFKVKMDLDPQIPERFVVLEETDPNPSPPKQRTLAQLPPSPPSPPERVDEFQPSHFDFLHTYREKEKLYANFDYVAKMINEH